MTTRERMERRLERREEWAGKARAASAAHFQAAHDAVKDIPLGQPILVGHHSERRHRRTLERSHAAGMRGVERGKMADRHAQVADTLEHQLKVSVFSDDDDAVEALEARIAAREADRERMKKVNKLYRKGDAAGLAALGLDLETLRAQIAAVGMSFVRVPYEGYQLSNLGNRIAADRKRLEFVKAQQARTAAAESSDTGVSIERTGDHVRVTFAEKPARSVLDALKAARFRWGGGSWIGRADALPSEIGGVA